MVQLLMSSLSDPCVYNCVLKVIYRQETQGGKEEEMVA